MITALPATTAAVVHAGENREGKIHGAMTCQRRAPPVLEIDSPGTCCVRCGCPSSRIRRRRSCRNSIASATSPSGSVQFFRLQGFRSRKRSFVTAHSWRPFEHSGALSTGVRAHYGLRRRARSEHSRRPPQSLGRVPMTSALLAGLSDATNHAWMDLLLTTSDSAAKERRPSANRARTLSRPYKVNPSAIRSTNLGGTHFPASPLTLCGRLWDDWKSSLLG